MGDRAIPLFAAGEPNMEAGASGNDNAGNDNVTDRCLAEFQRAYADPAITKDAIWEYVYGVMHATDWRERYRNDLRKSLPRIPLAADFEAFRLAGRELMALHVGYEAGPEADVAVEIETNDGETLRLDELATDAYPADLTMASSPPPPPGI